MNSLIYHPVIIISSLFTNCFNYAVDFPQCCTAVEPAGFGRPPGAQIPTRKTAAPGARSLGEWQPGRMEEGKTSLNRNSIIVESP